MPETLVYKSEELLRGAGAHRVDEDASYALAERLEDHAEEILFQAVRLVQRRGGKRLQAKDIMIAAEIIDE